MRLLSSASDAYLNLKQPKNTHPHTEKQPTKQAHYIWVWCASTLLLFQTHGELKVESLKYQMRRGGGVRHQEICLICLDRLETELYPSLWHFRKCLLLSINLQ